MANAAKIKYRHQNDGLNEELSVFTSIDFRDAEDRTIQSAKEDSNINVIVKRFGLTGNARVPSVEPFYGDFSQVEDYQSAMNMLVVAQRAFDQLPSDVRRRFGNDPDQLIEFLHDPENVEEGRKLGLIKPEETPPAPQKVEVVNQPAPEPAKGSEGL